MREPSNTLERWRLLCRAALHNPTEEQIEAVAQEAYRLDCAWTEGAPFGVWHAASVALRWPHCPCAKCAPGGRYEGRLH